jgi:hypothetical protein
MREVCQELALQNSRVLVGKYNDHSEVELKLLSCLMAVVSEVEKLQKQVECLWREV